MKKLNIYINEAWAGVKKQTQRQDVIAWCEEMKIENYTINPQGEIDVNGYVDLRYSDFKELPYKFGAVDGYFNLGGCKNLISLKNCPYFVGDSFSCSYCSKLESLEGCPQKVGSDFYCRKCKRQFTEKEVQSLCKVKKDIIE